MSGVEPPSSHIRRARLYREARARVDRIKVSLDGLQDLCDEVADSYAKRDWQALGYRTWDDMCAAEFSTTKLRLTDRARADLVLALRNGGMSDRAIGAATGLSKDTVSRDLARVSDETPHKVTGIDGKQYPVYVPRSSRPAASTAATHAVWQLRPVINMLEGAVRAGATLTPDERQAVGGYITQLRMLIGDEDTYDDVWHERSMAAYRGLRRRAR